MAFNDLPDIGQANWGTPLNAVLTELDTSEMRPTDQPYAAWTLNATNLLGQSALSAHGVGNMVRLAVRHPMTVTNVTYFVGTAGGTLTAGQNFVGLYDAAGNRIAVTADQTANFGAVGEHTAALVGGPYSLAQGYYHVDFLSNGAGAVPQFARGAALQTGGTNHQLNVGLTATTFNSATHGAGLTSLPATVTMSGRTANFVYWFAALS